MLRKLCLVSSVVALLTCCAPPSVEVYDLNDKLVLPAVESSYLYGETLVDVGNSMLFEDLELEKSFEEWKRVNDDCCAIIRVSSLGIEEPVVKSEFDNREYLRKDIYSNYSVAGTVFLDCRCNIDSSPIKVFHGHNMKDGTMFANLPQLLELDEFENDIFIDLYVEGGLATYKVFSVVSVDSSEEALPLDLLQDSDDVRLILNDLLDRSLVAGGSVTSNDAVILNTCWYGKTGMDRNLHCLVAATRVF